MVSAQVFAAVDDAGERGRLLRPLDQPGDEVVVSRDKLEVLRARDPRDVWAFGGDWDHRS